MKNRTNSGRIAGIAAAAFLGLSIPMAPAAATPVLYGDVDQIVTVQPDDCVGCSTQQLETLERGMDMMLREMKQRAVSGDVCVAEAGLARDMAALTFDAYRTGAISEIRWRDGLRAKARVSAQLTELTISNMLLSYRSRLQERVRGDFSPGSEDSLHADIYGSAQLARIFERMGQGEWNADLWLAALDAEPDGLDPNVDQIQQLQWPGRKVYNLQLVYGQSYAQWQESELVRMGQLPEDFLVGDIEARRDQLVEDYAQAMSAEPWGVMGFGCGASAAAGFRAYAQDLVRGLVVIVHYDKSTPVIHDEITVVGEEPENEDGSGGGGESGETVTVRVEVEAPAGTSFSFSFTAGQGSTPSGRPSGGSGQTPQVAQPSSEATESSESTETTETSEEEQTESCTTGEPGCNTTEGEGGNGLLNLVESGADLIGRGRSYLRGLSCRMVTPGAQAGPVTTHTTSGGIRIGLDSGLPTFAFEIGGSNTHSCVAPGN